MDQKEATKMIQTAEISLSKDQLEWYKIVGGLSNRRKDLYTIPIHKLMQIELYASEYFYNGNKSISMILQDLGISYHWNTKTRIQDYLFTYKKQIEEARYFLFSKMPKVEIQPKEATYLTIADWNNLTNEQKLSYL